jgi:hypothetical protein
VRGGTPLCGNRLWVFVDKNLFFVTKWHSQASDMIVMGLAAHQNNRVPKRICCGVDISSLFMRTCDSKEILFLRQPDRSELADE